MLAAPGPTNTLLTTSGAAAGVTKSLPLIIAAALGYVISTSLVALIFGPLAHASRALDVGLRVVCGLFLLYAAWRLWREGGAALDDKPVSFRRVLIATSLNPKGIVFAFVIVPYLRDALIQPSLPYMGALAALVVPAALAWIGVGAALRAGAGKGLSGGLARRAGAMVLTLFAALIAGSAFAA